MIITLLSLHTLNTFDRKIISKILKKYEDGRRETTKRPTSATFFEEQNDVPVLVFPKRPIIELYIGLLLLAKI
ncbi:MAG: hypothetical protein ACI8RD_010966 [Bacillariaceae sp.]|jgi:hypothetical protein